MNIIQSVGGGPIFYLGEGEWCKLADIFFRRRKVGFELGGMGC